MKEGCLEIVKATEEAGLVHNVGNALDQPVAMCNCCACACDMVRSFYSLDEPFNVVMTSNFIARLDAAACKGCGKCGRACPIGAVTLKKVIEPEETIRPVIDESICFGCGVCAKSCKQGGRS